MMCPLSVGLAAAACALAAGRGVAVAQAADILAAQKIRCMVESARQCAADGQCKDFPPSGKKDVVTIAFAARRADSGEAIRNARIQGEVRTFDFGGQGNSKATLTRDGKLTVVDTSADGGRHIAEAMCVALP